MELCLFDGSTEIEKLNSDDEILSDLPIRQNIGIHVDDDPNKFFDRKIKEITINSRCLVSVRDSELIGTVRYRGKCHSKSGIHVGIELDEPKGDTNGS